MNISVQKLKQIIIEEYIKEEGIDESQAAEDLLRQIIGDEEYEKRRGTRGAPPPPRPSDTEPMDKPHKASETMPMDAPETASEPHPVKAAVDGIYELVSGMDPEDVAEIFQIVFEKLPGVEMQDEQPPQTLYSPGAEGRPQVGFKLEELKELIRKILSERV